MYPTYNLVGHTSRSSQSEAGGSQGTAGSISIVEQMYEQLGFQSEARTTRSREEKGRSQDSSAHYVSNPIKHSRNVHKAGDGIRKMWYNEPIMAFAQAT